MKPLTFAAERRPVHAMDIKLMASLASLYGAIVIGWIAYQQYQPQLLIQFNFTEYTFVLTVAQTLILVITPPIAGRLADQYRFTIGHRFPIISLGISFAAMVFMAVAFSLLSNPGEVWKWILPVLIILWLIAMNLFTSPALSSIETFVPVEKLPRAMAVLTITANLLYSLEPVIVDIIDNLGAPLTFVAGGTFVFVTGIFLRRNASSFLRTTGGVEPKSESHHVTQRSAYVFVFLIGIMLGAVTTLLFNLFPAVAFSLSDASNSNHGKFIVVGVLVLSAVLSLPFSKLVTSMGLTTSFILSLLLCFIGTSLVFLNSIPWITLLGLAVFAMGYAALSVNALPLAMENSGFREKVFCVGVFFSGAAIPDGLFEILGAL